MLRSRKEATQKHPREDRRAFEAWFRRELKKCLAENEDILRALA